MRKPPRVRGWPRELDVGLSLFVEFRILSLSETRPALPGSLQGFRLLLKSWSLARYHRSELNGCLVISDATPPQPSLSRALPPDTVVNLANCPHQRAPLAETQYFAHFPHPKHLSKCTPPSFLKTATHIGPKILTNSGES